MISYHVFSVNGGEKNQNAAHTGRSLILSSCQINVQSWQDLAIKYKAHNDHHAMPVNPCLRIEHGYDHNTNMRGGQTNLFTSKLAGAPTVLDFCKPAHCWHSPLYLVVPTHSRRTSDNQVRSRFPSPDKFLEPEVECVGQSPYKWPTGRKMCVQKSWQWAVPRGISEPESRHAQNGNSCALGTRFETRKQWRVLRTRFEVWRISNSYSKFMWTMLRKVDRRGYATEFMIHLL